MLRVALSLCLALGALSGCSRAPTAPVAPCTGPYVMAPLCLQKGEPIPKDPYHP